MNVINAFLNDNTFSEFQSTVIGNRKKIIIKDSDYELWVAENAIGFKENFDEYNSYVNFINRFNDGNYLGYGLSNNSMYLAKKKIVPISIDYSSYEYREMLNIFNIISNLYYFNKLEVHDFGYVLSGKEKKYYLINFSNLILKPIVNNNYSNFQCNCGKELFQNLDHLLMGSNENVFCTECKGQELKKSFNYLEYKRQRGI